MLVALTGIGLATAAGLNAYIPFLVVALLARLTDVVTLPDSLTWMESWWAIGIGTVLLVADVVLDKVPVVDTVNDAVQTAIRPLSGGVVFAATSAAADLEQSDWVERHAWVPFVAGVLVAGLVHAGKATVRPVVNAATLGAGAPVVSTVEDGTSVGLSLAAVFVPLLVLVLLVALVVAFVMLRRRRRAATRGPDPA
ncbi:DUF4126 domain-containing protein [Cellulomonas palmilytica]|uniref:DUF4126 domain-containing protein n=1 Tax=Cellulomonas palmilytica TaxID=2608402 RepID=UPI001F3BD9DD|nr:DUF4126 domain-containing protein [Cellulomonas palmilytica]UJP39169.1 DUF4126 domain-containing protein [Cellulomonas palmilytica]